MPASPHRLAPVLALAGLGLVAGCGQAGVTTTARSAPATATSATPGTAWTDQPVSFQAGGLTVLNPANALFLSQADRYDPAQLAARLTPGLPVLVSCSTADLRVTCGEVRHLLGGLAAARADTDFVRLTGMDHVLKQDPTGSTAGYTEPLPFSPQLRQALRTFVARHL